MNGKAKNYTEAIARLDDILEQIDQNQVPLDELAARVEEASELLKYCKDVLTKTEAKVSGVLDELEKDFGEDEEQG
ncbi:MAG TPA: exodeoxyribonuclease VII small subunit [Fibrobacteria bacterium]|jgi:exodeoxyribonuclease VII small subunit|nr:exodeoxyribonuclease VII small subunit [Fibrobacteria bacterium]